MHRRDMHRDVCTVSPLLRALVPSRGVAGFIGFTVVALALVAEALTAPPAEAQAAGPSGQVLTATVDRTETTLDSPLRLTLTVSGDQQAEPRMAEMSGFDVSFAGQMSRIHMINGRTSASVQYEYLLAPRATGTFTIPPATVDVDGKTHQSQPIQVRVVEASRAPEDSRDVFVSASVSTRDPYLGQQVLYTWRLYTRTRIGDPRLDLPDFEGFLREDLGDVREYQATLDGQRYRVSEFHKALFPQEQGTLVIPATTLRLQVAVASSRQRRRSPLDSFFGRTVTEPRVLRTQPIELTVRPLPAPPPDFSGLVGDFRLQARISQQELQVGESATLTFTVSGTGNAQMISEPAIPELSSFKIYNDQPSTKINRSDSGISGTKSYSKALVPLVPGELTVPPVSLRYFDVETGSYRLAQTPELTLQVRPAEGEEELRLTESMAPTTGKVAVRILADDILPLHRGLDAVESTWLDAAGRLAFLLGLLAPGLLFVGLVVLQRRQERFGSGWRRRREALRRARESLAELTERDHPQAVAKSASAMLRSYIGDKLDLEGRALTPVEAAEHLLQAGAGEGLAVETEEILARLEAIQFGALGGSAGDLQREIEEHLQRLEEALS